MDKYNEDCIRKNFSACKMYSISMKMADVIVARLMQRSLVHAQFVEFLQCCNASLLLYFNINFSYLYNQSTDEIDIHHVPEKRDR